MANPQAEFSILYNQLREDFQKFMLIRGVFSFHFALGLHFQIDSAVSFQSGRLSCLES